MKIIETDRLVLRTWKAADIEPYYNMMQDPKVIEFLRGSLSMQEVVDYISTVNRHQETLGYTLWAVELKEGGKFIGYIGLNYTDFLAPFDADFTPAIEVGWRLDSQYWGRGYATEGAKASLDYGFNILGIKEIIAFTSKVNLRSIKIMDKLGMIRDLNSDFAHPKLDRNHRLSQHLLYRIEK